MSKIVYNDVLMNSEMGKQSENESEEHFNDRFARAMIQKVRTSIHESTDLAEMVLNAKRALNAALETWKSQWLEVIEGSKSILVEFRQHTALVDIEAKRYQRSLKDLLEFLGSKETAERLQKLRELTEIAERLQKLQASGFLDAVVDIMLKVDETNKPG